MHRIGWFIILAAAMIWPAGGRAAAEDSNGSAAVRQPAAAGKPGKPAMKDTVKMNRLAKEKSPYLLQHKDNPVNWYGWGEEAFSAARQESKPIFLSIGYSTCYWCHVMEKDSFEREDVAAVLNRDFISIKVDREERPDVDRIYMDAVMAISGHGGWPMSVFLTPEGKPFFGATFFYRDQFIKLLGSVASSWRDRRPELEKVSQQIVSALNEAAAEAQPVDLKLPGAEIFDSMKKQLASAFDAKNGGFGPAPKFPHAGAVELLLRIYQRSGGADKEALEIAAVTLDRMARGGIFDQLAGGFARYSTDAGWKVPHFEKMLYDNAQLTLAYLSGFQAAGSDKFGQVAEETLDFLLREMTSPEGGFYSALDAGEVGKEGDYYLWAASEIDAELDGSSTETFKKYFGVTGKGNFEHGTNILSIDPALEWRDRSTEPLKSARQKLLNKRSARPRPHLDDKILVSWNGLAISALARGHQVLGRPEYLSAAQKAAGFIIERLASGPRLQRRYRGGSAGINAVLDDYACLIQGLIDLYEADFDRRWLEQAEKLQQQQDQLLWRPSQHGYSYTAGDDRTIAEQPVSFADGAEPSGNGISALNLLRLAKFGARREPEQRARAVIAAALGSRMPHPLALASSLAAFDFNLGPAPEIAVVIAHHSELEELRRNLAAQFIPNRVLAAGVPVDLNDENAPVLLRGKQLREGKTTYYICKNHTCREPVTDFGLALKLIRGQAPAESNQ